MNPIAGLAFEWGLVGVAILALSLIVYRVLGPLPRVSWRECYLALPFIDRETGNWSLTRTICLIVTFAFVHVVEEKHGFNWPSVAIFGLIMVGAFSKSIADFSKGASAVLDRFRRKSDARPVVAEPDGEVHVKSGD